MSLSIRHAVCLRYVPNTTKHGATLSLYRLRISSHSNRRRYLNSGSVGPSPGQAGFQEEETAQGSEAKPSSSRWGPTFFKMAESAATTLASILVLA